MTLGATPSNIVRLVVADGVRWTGVGVIIGTAASAGLLHLLQGLLYQVKAYDFRVFAMAIIVLVGVAIIAAWLPAQRTAHVDPVSALRHD